ncbi:hypothetical protein [Streptomyces sp. SYSU K217416]
MTALTLVKPAASAVSWSVTALQEALDPEFLELMGWDPAVRLLTFPPEHPQLGGACAR